MTVEREGNPNGLAYRARLDQTEEAIISSHFMQELCTDSSLELYDDEELSAKSVSIPARVVRANLLPTVLRAANTFARERASSAKRRAATYCASYGLTDPAKLGPAELITEVMFDPQFRRGPRETCSRRDVSSKVARRIAMGAPIKMVIPALPYKFSCPLKTRGQLPDLAEVNFIIGLYEIVAAIEALYREARPNLQPPLATFTIVSDGSRFNRLTNEPDAVIRAYQEGVARWIKLLQLGDYIELLDYCAILHERLPQAVRDSKEELRRRALRQYTDVMSAHFEPLNMAETLKAAVLNDPDPEQANAEGRFVSLLKSLAFTVKYRTLDPLRSLPLERFRGLYRELTGHLLEPFVIQSNDELRCVGAVQDSYSYPLALDIMEHLRRGMLEEVWTATIAYVAEIRSDRDQIRDPISDCLPDHLRWTIHGKPGQMGLRSPSAFGKMVLPWAGAAVFKRNKQGRIKLCTLPVLALEGAGAIPVRSSTGVDASRRTEQPLFYIYPDVGFSNISDFLGDLSSQLVRRRVS